MFYSFDQNNSFGRFESNGAAGIAHHVIIEAPSADAANHRAEGIGIYFDGCDHGLDCSCCGDRWHRVSEHDAREFPHIYGEEVSMSNAYRFGGVIFAAVHYLDGRVEVYE